MAPARHGNGRTRPADLAITDEYDVVHRVWKLTDPALINLILTAMADKKLIIADGHHRYETSVAYAQGSGPPNSKLPLGEPVDEDEKVSSGHLPAPPFPEAAMMMTFVNMEAPGITILPTHRVVFGLRKLLLTRLHHQGEQSSTNVTELADAHPRPGADRAARWPLPGTLLSRPPATATTC